MAVGVGAELVTLRGRSDLSVARSRFLPGSRDPRISGVVVLGGQSARDRWIRMFGVGEEVAGAAG